MEGPLDWSRLTRLAVESHATPGLWEVVSAFPNLPVEAGALQTVAVVDDFRRLHIRRLVARTVADLRGEGIEVLVLKGAALLAGGVDKPRPRTMADIDLLVFSGSPEHAWRVCQKKGWRIADPTATEELYRDHHHLPPLDDSDGVRVGLELHRTILPGVQRLGLDIDEILERSRMVAIGGVEVRVPSREDILLHACLHFAWSNKLGRGGWRTYADAQAIIADPAFDWQRFLATATSARMRRCCYWTLRIGARVADLPVPLDVLRSLDPSSGGPLGTLLARHFSSRVSNPDAMSMVSERLQRWCWFAAMGESSTSDEADAVWSEGDLGQPESQRVDLPPSRGALRAAIGTMSYLARLAFRD